MIWVWDRLFRKFLLFLFNFRYNFLLWIFRDYELFKNIFVFLFSNYSSLWGLIRLFLSILTEMNLKKPLIFFKKIRKNLEENNIFSIEITFLFGVLSYSHIFNTDNSNISNTLYYAPHLPLNIMKLKISFKISFTCKEDMKFSWQNWVWYIVIQKLVSGGYENWITLNVNSFFIIFSSFKIYRMMLYHFVYTARSPNKITNVGNTTRTSSNRISNLVDFLVIQLCRTHFTGQ